MCVCACLYYFHYFVSGCPGLYTDLHINEQTGTELLLEFCFAVWCPEHDAITKGAWEGKYGGQQRFIVGARLGSRGRDEPSFLPTSDFFKGPTT